MSLNSWLRFDYSWLDAQGKRLRGLSRPAADVKDAVPKHTTGFLFSHRLPDNWTLSGFLQYTDMVRWRSGTNVDSYTRTDIKLSKTWKMGKTQGEIAITAQNLFDESYLEYQRNNDFSRRTFLSMSIQWP